jgi:hypothetical protein
VRELELHVRLAVFRVLGLLREKGQEKRGCKTRDGAREMDVAVVPFSSSFAVTSSSPSLSCYTSPVLHSFTAFFHFQERLARENMQIRVLERQDAARRKKEEVERRAAERAEIMEEMKRHQKQVLPRVLAPASSTCTLAFSFVPSHPRVQSGVGTRGPWKLALIGC